MTSRDIVLREETFTGAETTRMTGVPSNRRRQWRKRGFLPLKSETSRTSLKEVVWVSALAECVKFAPLGAASANLNPVIDFALVQLARQTMPWPVEKPGIDLARGHSPLQDNATSDRELTDLLGMPEGPLFRYIVIGGREAGLQANTLEELNAQGSAPAMSALDGYAIARRIVPVLVRCPFAWTYSGTP